MPSHHGLTSETIPPTTWPSLIATKDDLNRLAQIYTDAYNSLNIGEHWDSSSAHQLLLHLYEHQSDLFFVAIKDGQVVGGIVSLVKPWWDGNHITDGELFVDPNHQGSGIGSLLIKRMFEEAKDKYDAVSWDTFTHVVHDHPLKWYKKLGFKEIKEWTMITENIDEVLVNVKKLDQESARSPQRP